MTREQNEILNELAKVCGTHVEGLFSKMVNNPNEYNATYSLVEVHEMLITIASQFNNLQQNYVSLQNDHEELKSLNQLHTKELGKALVSLKKDNF